MNKIKISVLAAEDMDNIWQYTSENWSISQANTMYDLLRDQIFHIAKNKNAGKPYDEVQIGLKGSILNPFIIFYKEDTIGTINIERVLHQSVDINQHF